jgi:hypothetical protein
VVHSLDEASTFRGLRKGEVRRISLLRLYEK